MATTDVEPQAEIDSRPGFHSGFARKIGRYLWLVIRMPALVFLMIVEPIVSFVLAAVALLGILVSFFFEFSGAAPHFPFWLIFGLSLGCGALVIVLNAVMRGLAR
jgi:hypothetical protein